MAIPLSAALAQRIIDLVSPGIPYNVNIMDATGLIIAAVNPERVGTMHRGARVVLESGKAYRARAADPAAGIQPGVNLPFRSGNRVVGVVGVTGDPAEVESVARVLRVTVELTVALEADQSASEIHRSRDRDFLSRLVHDTDAVAAGFLDRGLAQLPRPWRLTAFVARAKGAQGSWPVNVLRQIEAEFPKTMRRWGIFEGALWVLGPEPRFLDATERQQFVSVVTPPAASSSDLAITTRVLVVIARHPHLLSVDQFYWSTDDLTAEVLVATAPSNIIETLAYPLRHVKSKQRELLAAYLATGGNMSDIALRLGVHRNSVARGLGTLRDLTGLDVRSSRGQLGLGIALAAERRGVQPGS
ncbi:hypothetical protein E3T43_17940 [Cryobacterium sp. Hh7]|uniref:sugar diacid recognition domain-containing protein n=1 Tax=Cryobacterium sp. Hh7 TaxID=1259159 RepID=UPI00106ACE85|nr:sugar diacid recognition domain-containing protein [Cryobacterium sp. Hh7]TFD50716.1 hypothetical protein E3T43_17940 [Cryobacterium sp. Hh7]